MRRRNARESKDTELLSLKVELGQLKYERAALYEEVHSWKLWYDTFHFTYIDAQLMGGSAETETGIDKYELPAKVATDLHDMGSGVDRLLQELTSLRSGVVDESTDVGSLASASGVDSNISDIHHAEADMGKTHSSCMGKGRGCIKSRQAEPVNNEEAVEKQPAEIVTQPTVHTEMLTCAHHTQRLLCRGTGHIRRCESCYFVDGRFGKNQRCVRECAVVDGVWGPTVCSRECKPGALNSG